MSTIRSRWKAGLLVGADGAKITRIGIGQHAGEACRQQAIGELAGQRRAVAAADHVGLADELVDAAGAVRLVAVADVPIGQAIALQIAERTLAAVTMN